MNNHIELTEKDWVMTEKDWELLEAIDDDITSGGADELGTFLDSLKEEEVVAMVKWLRRNTDEYYPAGDYTSRVAKSIVVERYITTNAMEAVGNNLTTVSQMIKLWQFAQDNR